MTENGHQSPDPLADLIGEGGEAEQAAPQQVKRPSGQQRQSFQRSEQPAMSRRQARQAQQQSAHQGDQKVPAPDPRTERPEQQRSHQTPQQSKEDEGRRLDRIEQGMQGARQPKSMNDDLVEIDYNAPDHPLSDVYPPQEGFKGWLYKTFSWDLGASHDEIERRRAERTRLDREFMHKQQDHEYFHQINRQKLRTRGYCGFITVESEKGGVGKTSVSSLLAYVMGEERQDPIVVADLNPDRGSLPKRMGVEPQYSIRDLVNNADQIPYKRHVHEFVEKVPGANVSVLSGDMRPDRRESTSAEDVITVSQVFQPFFSIAILDNGTGITHSALAGSHKVAHGIALVIDNTDDAYDFVKSTLSYLESRKLNDLRNRVVLVIVDKVQDPGKHTESSIIEGARQSSHSHDIMQYFADYVRDVVVIPFDPVLAKSGPIVFQHLNPETIRATKRLAASLMDDLVE